MSKVEQILALLGDADCGVCDYPTCLEAAEAIAAGEAAYDLCPLVGDDEHEQTKTIVG